MVSQQYSLYGINAVATALELSPDRVTQLIIQAGLNSKTLQQLQAQAKQHGIAVSTANKKELDKLSKQGNHQGVLAYRQGLPSMSFETLEQRISSMMDQAIAPIILVLDQIQDPRNLGACLRSADAVGVTAVIVPDKNSASLTDVACKTACGAAETVPLVRVTNLARALRSLKALGVWLIGTDQDGDQLYHQTDYTGAIALVMGNEGQGLRRLTKEHCDFLVKLPMAGAVSSLNISVATGVCLYEVVRQREG